MNDLPESIPKPAISGGVSEGWWSLVEKLHKGLLKIDPEYRVSQIKEKFGELRYYYTPSFDISTEEGNRKYQEMDILVGTAETVSANTCEWCGELGECHAIEGWLKTLCSKHTKEWEKGKRPWDNEDERSREKSKTAKEA